MLDADYPSEWRRLRLQDVAEVRTGLAKGKKDIKDPVKLPYLRVANVQDGHLDLREIKRITVARAEVERYLLQEGDVLLTEGGDFDKLGRGTMWQDEIPQCLHQNHVFVVRANRDELLPDYLVWLTNSPHGREYFRRCSKQSTNLASINTRQLKHYPMVLPEMTEQLRIAKVLRCADSGLHVVNRLLRARRKLKRGLFQQLLTGEQRFPEFRDQPWVERKLGELFTERNELGRMDLPLLAITATRGIVARDSLQRGDTSSADKSQYKRVAPGDLGYNTMRMWQGVSALSSLEGIVSPAYTICIPGPAVHGPYFAHLFKFAPIVHRFWRFSQGLVDDTLNLKYPAFSLIPVQIPSVAEQVRIADVLDAADREIQALTGLHEALKEQKKGLMQQLLTGKVRVPASMLKGAAHA